MVKSLAIFVFSTLLVTPAKIDKLSFYKAFESNSQEKIESKLSSIDKLYDSSQKDAYAGALIMKQSQFFETPKEKANRFKVGKELLEKAILSQPKNPEYRFLRFAIQENAPKILKYNGNLQEDKEIIIANFKSLDVVVKKVVQEYSKTSTNLPSEQLK